jgi:hypothetical protein
MSSYGLKVFDANENVIMDTDTVIGRLRYSSEVSSGSSSNTTLSDIDGLSTIEISVKMDSTYNSCPHTVSRSGTTISWAANSDGGNFTSAASLIFVFLYS